MVRLSFPNLANSFQKCHNFYTIQQNVSHPSLFLTHFWDHNMHQSILCWQMRLSSLTTLQAIMPLSFRLMTREWSLCEKSPHIPSVKSVMPVKLGLTNWNMKFDTSLPFTSIQYIKTTAVPHLEQGSADSPTADSNLYHAFLPANETSLKTLLYPAETSWSSDQRGI